MEPPQWIGLFVCLLLTLGVSSCQSQQPPPFPLSPEQYQSIFQIFDEIRIELNECVEDGCRVTPEIVTASMDKRNPDFRAALNDEQWLNYVEYQKSWWVRSLHKMYRQSASQIGSYGRRHPIQRGGYPR